MLPPKGLFGTRVSHIRSRRMLRRLRRRDLNPSRWGYEPPVDTCLPRVWYNTPVRFSVPRGLRRLLSQDALIPLGCRYSYSVTGATGDFAAAIFSP